MTQKTTKTTETEIPVKPRKVVGAPKKLTTSNVSSYTKWVLNSIFVIAVAILIYKIGHKLYTKKLEYDLTKKDIACPTLLSISRSARDTLLVMKAEELCTIYVLDNIK